MADTIYGTPDNDVINGTPLNEWIYGYDGNDIISGLGGYDLIVGGNGNDTLYGDAGNDNLNGGEGNDKLSGGADNDQLFGGSGNDTMRGGAGADHLTGGAGHDSMYAGLDLLKDTFYFGKDALGSQSNVWASADYIYEFDAAHDVVKIDLASGEGDVIVQDVGANTHVYVKGDFDGVVGTETIAMSFVGGGNGVSEADFLFV